MKRRSPWGLRGLRKRRFRNRRRFRRGRRPRRTTRRPRRRFRRVRRSRLPKQLYDQINPKITKTYQISQMVNSQSYGTKKWGLTYPVANVMDISRIYDDYGGLAGNLQGQDKEGGNSSVLTITGDYGQNRASFYIKKHQVSNVFHNCTNATQYYTLYYTVAKRDIIGDDVKAMHEYGGNTDQNGGTNWSYDTPVILPIFDHTDEGVTNGHTTIADLLEAGMKADNKNNVLTNFGGYNNTSNRDRGGANSNTYYSRFKVTATPASTKESGYFVNEPMIGVAPTGEVNPNSITPTGRTSLIYHPECTPYKSPDFMQYFKIYKRKKFALKPGETKIIKQTQSKKVIPYKWISDNIAKGTGNPYDNSEVWALKGVTKFILFSQVGSIVTPNTSDSGNVGAVNSTRNYNTYSMSTALTCTGLIHRIKLISRLLPSSRSYRIYGDNFGVINYQNKESFTGVLDPVYQLQSHHANVKIQVATTTAENDQAINTV
nr:MAG: putative capsid protein [Arizlama virus]